MKKILASLVALGCIAAIAMFALNIQDNSLTFFSDDFTQDEKEFMSFIAKYRKSYLAKTDYQKRFGIFKENLQVIKDNDDEDLILGVTEFADLSFEEFSSTYLGYKHSAPQQEQPIIGTESLPKSVDWTTTGAVTGVKNQGSCGSCWAFSTTGSVEGINFIKNGVLESFSEQELVDCSTSYGNQGCQGGLMDNGFKYIIASGDETESAYPYTGANGSCHASGAGSVKITGYTDVPSGDETQLQAACANQPVSVAVGANLWWQLYMGGVMKKWKCSGKSLDHGVLLVGYNQDEQTYKIKNSWGAGWGEKGYIRLAMGKNVCGLATQASYPTV